MYFDKNKLVIFRDDNWYLSIAYPNKDKTKYYFIGSGKVVSNPEKMGLTQYGRFEDTPVVMVLNPFTKKETKTYQTIKYLTEEDVRSLQNKINRKQHETNGEYLVQNLVVAVDKTDPAQNKYICLPELSGKMFIISKNEMVDANTMELVGEFEPIYMNVIMTSCKQICNVVSLSERDVLSLEDKLNNEKIAYSVKDQEQDMNF